MNPQVMANGKWTDCELLAKIPYRYSLTGYNYRIRVNGEVKIVPGGAFRNFYTHPKEK